jgi:hypothetical protein
MDITPLQPATALLADFPAQLIIFLIIGAIAVIKGIVESAKNKQTGQVTRTNAPIVRQQQAAPTQQRWANNDDDDDDWDEDDEEIEVVSDPYRRNPAPYASPSAPGRPVPPPPAARGRVNLEVLLGRESVQEREAKRRAHLTNTPTSIETRSSNFQARTEHTNVRPRTDQASFEPSVQNRRVIADHLIKDGLSDGLSSEVFATANGLRANDGASEGRMTATGGDLNWDPEDARRAIIMSEIIGKPMAFRDTHREEM